MENIVDCTAMNDGFSKGIEVLEELRKYLSSDAVLQRLHDELGVVAFVRAAEEEKIAGEHAETPADGFSCRTGLKGRREGED
jgi:hypothetical protein